MVDAITGATVQVVLEKTLSLANDRIGAVVGFKKDLQRLKESAEMIQDVLADAEEKQSGSRPVQRWLKKLEGVAYDAYYVLDELNYQLLRRQVKSRNQFKGKVCKFFFLSKDDISFRWRMASKVRDINKTLKDINQEATEFGLTKMEARFHPVTSGVTMSRQTDSIVAPNVVGRDADETKIVDILLSSSEKVVSVIHLTGMGGLGKTTLAKSVYNNQRIQEHFSKRIWICVSDKKFDGTRLFSLMLEQLLGDNVQLDGREAIVQRVRKELEGKKYLLVLDDVWNEDKGLWDNFFDSLVGLSTTGERSWCLVTSRKLSLLATLDHHHYPLGKLSDENCWSILAEKAIAGGEEVPEELGRMREPIIKRCGGLPLAAKVLGSFLSWQKKEEWPLILEKRLLSVIEDHENSVMQILKLSFDYLPTSSIKKCFAYLSIFEKDTELEGDELVELWMAEGFLQHDLRRERVMENIGDKYLTILLQSSLLEEVSPGDGGRYKMHDLVHDLAQSISKHESINLEIEEMDNSCKVRYLALDSFEKTPEKILEALSASVRTLFLESSIDMLSKFKYLHVLKISGMYMEELPSSIGKLKHLRYIHLPFSHMRMLPESLCNLYNLQTLRMNGLPFLECLPKKMSNLISLRHLHFFNHLPELQMPIEMGRLTCLQTLKFFNIGKEKGRQIEELGCLKDLKGKLMIRNLELVNGKEAAKRANLSGKPNLTKLEFQWCGYCQEGENYDEQVLVGLEPHPNLQMLTICRFMGDQFPPWFGNLSMLVGLKLIDCKKCVQLPVLGHLPCLKTLEFSELEKLSCIGASFYGLDDCSAGKGLESTSCSSGGGQALVSVSRRKLFPALKDLRLMNMRNLTEWKEAKVSGDDDAVFPVLEYLSIENCSQLTTAPTHFPSLKNLSIEGNVQVLAVKGILSKATSTIASLSFSEMDGLTCLSDVVTEELHPNNSSHLNLKYPNLMTCPNVASLQGCGYCLEVLSLENCENLTELPQDLCRFQSLRELHITGCPRILHIGPPLDPILTSDNNTAGQQQQNKNQNIIKDHLKSLKYVRIGNCNRLISIARETFECCTTLSSLAVYNCPSLVSFPLDFQQTPSLSGFRLSDCPKLSDKNNTPRGFGHLNRLSYVRIGPFDSSVEWFDWSGLMSCSSTLDELQLHGLPHMESVLPDQIQHLTSLRRLELWGFKSIEALPDWLGNLTSLEELCLSYCQKLQYLPSMPAMRRLTKLRRIETNDCPLLKERCRLESGPNSEWSKISHLPGIEVDHYSEDESS